MTKTSQQRRQQRAKATAAKRELRKRKGNGASELVTRKEANEAFQQLAQNQQRLGEMYNQLAHGIGKAATLTDAHLHVQRRISEDIVKGNIRLTPMHPDDVEYLATNPPWAEERRRRWLHVGDQSIDYGWYHQQYNAVLGLIYALEPLSKKLKSKTEEPEPEEADFVFGGDHESQDSSAGQADRPNG